MLSGPGELVVWSGSAVECCAICREERLEAFLKDLPTCQAFQIGVDICRVLDCTHVFHAKCIDMCLGLSSQFARGRTHLYIHRPFMRIMGYTRTRIYINVRYSFQFCLKGGGIA